MATFKQKYPEAAGKWTSNSTSAMLSTSGKKLVRFDITNADPGQAGSGFAVTSGGGAGEVFGLGFLSRRFFVSTRAVGVSPPRNPTSLRSDSMESSGP